MKKHKKEPVTFSNHTFVIVLKKNDFEGFAAIYLEYLLKSLHLFGSMSIFAYNSSKTLKKVL